MSPKRFSAPIGFHLVVDSRGASPARFVPSVLTVAAATGALGLLASAPMAGAQSSGFTGPYQITDPAPSGNWTEATVQDPANTTYDLDTSGAPASVVLSITTTFYPSQDTLTISNTAASTGVVSFSWFTNGQTGFTGTDSESDFFTGSGSTASYTRLNTVSTGTNSGTANFDVTAGEAFGFRVEAAYHGSEALTISDFAAPVPEPDPLAWMAFGVGGLLLAREVRRRRRASESGLPEAVR